MLIYYMNIFVLILTYFVIQKFHISEKGKKALFCIYSFLQMSMLSSFRYNIGTDYMSYMRLYGESLKYGINYYYFEPGYNLINWLSDCIGGGFTCSIVISAFLTVGPILYTIYRYSENTLLSVLLYIMFGFYTASFSLIRTHLAVAISLLAIPFLRKRNFFIYTIIVLIASLFHITALVMIPFYYCLNLPWRVRQFIISVLCIFSALFLVKPIMILGAKIYPRYEYYITSIFNYGYGIQSLFLVAIFLFIGVMYKKQLTHNKEWKIFYINYMLYGFILSLFQLQFIVMDRFVPFFTLPASILCIPNISNSYLNNKKNKVIFTILIFSFALLYYSYILYRNWNGVTPYQSILNK